MSCSKARSPVPRRPRSSASAPARPTAPPWRSRWPCGRATPRTSRASGTRSACSRKPATRTWCEVYDFGVLPGDYPFLTMELLSGERLGERLRNRGRGWPDFYDMAIQAAAGLAHIHRHGVVHMDIKPANLGIASDSNPEGGLTLKILDFGLAQEARGPLDRRIRGTLAYTAPEVLLQDSYDHRADLYSLGMTLYELATGMLPSAGDDLAAVRFHLEGTLPDPRSIRPDMPTELSRILARLLRRDPAERYASAGRLLVALGEAAGRPIDAAALSFSEGTVLASRLVGRGEILDPAALRSRGGGRGARQRRRDRRQGGDRQEPHPARVPPVRLDRRRARGARGRPGRALAAAGALSRRAQGRPAGDQGYRGGPAGGGVRPAGALSSLPGDLAAARRPCPDRGTDRPAARRPPPRRQGVRGAARLSRGGSARRRRPARGNPPRPGDPAHRGRAQLRPGAYPPAAAQPRRERPTRRRLPGDLEPPRDLLRLGLRPVRGLAGRSPAAPAPPRRRPGAAVPGRGVEAVPALAVALGELARGARGADLAASDGAPATETGKRSKAPR